MLEGGESDSTMGVMATLGNEHSISEVTRRPILDLISARWSGRLDEVDFLRRLYNLDAMPSTDGRFPTAADDIWKHRIANYDWDDDWVFNDKRFNILRGTDEGFIRFIAETVHPIVRSDAAEVGKLVTAFNEFLEVNGWCLTEVRKLSGRPVYGGEWLGEGPRLFEEPTGWPKVDRQQQHVRQALRQANTEEAFQSIGLVCRELLISVAQATYDASQYPPLDDVEPSETDAQRALVSA